MLYWLCVQVGESSKERRQKLSVKFLLHAAGNVAAKFPYEPVYFQFSCLMIICITFVSLILILHCALFWHQVLVGAFRKIPKATWNAKERYLSLKSLNIFIIFNIYGIAVVQFSQFQELSGDLNFSLIYFQWTCRLWMFPISSLSSAETILSEIPGYKVEVIVLFFFFVMIVYIVAICVFWSLSFPYIVFKVENLDSLVQRAIAAASAIPDLRGIC